MINIKVLVIKTDLISVIMFLGFTGVINYNIYYYELDVFFYFFLEYGFGY